MSRIPMRGAVLASLAAGLVATSAAAQTTALADIRDIAPREHREQVFVLTAPQTVAIEAVAAEPRRERRDKRWNNDSWWGNDEERDVWPAAAWIIDARTREVVWDVRTANAERSREGVRRFSGSVRLPAGTFIAHYGSYVATSITNFDNNGSLASFMRGLGSRARGNRGVRYGGPYVDDGSYRDFQLVVRGDGRRASAEEAVQASRPTYADAIVSIMPDSGGASERRGFELTRAADIEVIAGGEMNRDGDYDYGWIQDAATRRRVWEMTYRRSQEAGGAHKNRRVRETIHLPAGRYVAYYVTDESHDTYEWNAVPPFDPATYGLTLRIADQAARAGVRAFDWEPVPQGQTLVSMIGVGDREMRNEGFTLTRAMDLRIYAIGEGSNPDGDMDDYAWIVDANTRRRVWTMRYDDTEHAGGGQKNRLFDGTVRLEPGSYMVYYSSDANHSVAEWNDSPPAEARYYGISIFPASGTLDRSVVQPFTRTGASAATIAELVRMRDDVNARRSFTVDREQDVRVYAIGEGIDGEMYDYGWIENAETGRAVWEMTWRSTTRAGGASKNRLFDGTVHLPAGRYVLRWQSDGSHSFGDWNDDAPEDPEMWGITVSRR